MRSVTIPSNYVFRSSNPNAGITSPHTGFPPGFSSDRHCLSPELVRAVERAHYQPAEKAFQDVSKHPELYLGDRLFLRVNVDEFGNPGVETWPEYAIRLNSTVRALMPSANFPRPLAAPPCDLTDSDIRELYHAAISAGVPFSYAIVRPKFAHVGNILVFFPSHFPSYGAAACDKLGTCIDPMTFTKENPFDPSVIHIAMPWLSEHKFGGTHVILVGAGRKRMTVVNGGPYDGGTKKPVTFQLYDRLMPAKSPFVCQHDAQTEQLDGSVISIGKTTAAGKSEGSSDEKELPTPNRLFWGAGDNAVSVNLDPATSSLIQVSRHKQSMRRVISDDISVMMADHLGDPYAAESEMNHFYRNDLYSDAHPIQHIKNCAEGRVRGRIYYYNVGYDPKKRRFLPAKHVLLDPNTYDTVVGGTNPRISYPTETIPGIVPTCHRNLVKVNYLVLSVPVPKMPTSWHMPTFLRVDKWQFFSHCCHGARANKGNPALGEKGVGFWAFEGFCGKAGFTLDTEAMMLTRDIQFWQTLRDDVRCYIVFNTHSMGAQQEFKYSGTFLLRALFENWGPELDAAQLLPIPGTFNGGVPDLSTFLPSDALDPRVWDPRTLNQEYLERDARSFDHFPYVAMNNLCTQHGLSDNTTILLGDLMRKYIKGRQAS